MALKLITKNRAHPWKPLVPILNALHKMGGFPFRIHEEKQDEVEASHFGDLVTFEEHVTALSAHAAKIIFNITLQVVWQFTV
jgi:hypothetical protein